MANDDDWYAKLGPDERFRQGDLVEGIPIVSPKLHVEGESVPSNAQIISAHGHEFTVAVKKYDVVILSQSCDLEQEKLAHVLVCPYYSVESVEQEEHWICKTENREALRQGNVPAYHLIPPCTLEGITLGFAVVSFRDAQTVPYAYLKAIAAKQPYRLRLNMPYREYLSQAYARFIMRVGLPRPMPSLPKYKAPKK